MKYDFDRAVPRYGTASVKWDLADGLFGGRDLLPLWVADMDFPAPEPVLEALEKRVRHGIFGYTACMDDYYKAVMDWMGRRHTWKVSREWIVFSPGVVPALAMLVRALSKEGDGVIIQPPVYYPFRGMVRLNGRNVVNNPLMFDGGRYAMDLAHLEKTIAELKARLLILCSPHNPVGRVWTRDELSGLAEVCLRHGVTVISDEIHADLVPGRIRHVPFASLSPEVAAITATCTAPSKTFNLPGLQTANVIIADAEKRTAFSKEVERNGIHGPNPFGMDALIAAYRHGEEWLDQLLAYIEGNLSYLREFIAARIPRIKVVEPEGTFLVWLDFRALGMDADALKTFMVEGAHVALDDGSIFGRAEGAGFERINIACPRAVLREALERIEGAVKGLEKKIAYPRIMV